MEVKRNFPKDTKMTNKYIKRCSISLAIKRNTNQNHNKILLHPTRMAIILKKTDNTKCSQGYREIETSYTDK